MINEKAYQLIDGYLKDELNDQEHLEFIRAMETDIEFREELEIQKKLFNVFSKSKGSVASTSEIKNAILEASEQYRDSNTKVIPLNRRYLIGIAASVLLLLGYFAWNPSQDSLEQMYVSNSDWSELPSLTVREDVKNDISDAQSQFENKDFENASTAFKRFISEGNKNPQILTYLGISYLELGRYQEAIDTFNDLESGKSLDSSKASWYKALTYLKWNKKEEAITTLNHLIKNPANFKYREAKDLLEKLN